MSDFAALSLSTERLLLRPLRPGDAAGLFAIRSHAEVMRYGVSLPWDNIALAEAKIATDMAAMDSGDYLQLGVERCDDQALIGTCTLFHLDAQCRRAEIGYALRHDTWGQGYMQEALLAVLGYGFEVLQLNRIEADIDPRNLASAKILLRLGFVCEGVLRERWIVNGEKSASAFYGLLAADWNAQQRCIIG